MLHPAVSNGVLQGDLPVNFALPLLTLQITLVVVVTRSLAFLFKRIKQPRVLAEIIGGVLLGPTALGRNKVYMDTIFPKESIPLLETVAVMGLMFFIFMVGLGLDLKALKKTGNRALFIGLIGIAAPFILSIPFSVLLRAIVLDNAKLGPLIVFVGTPLSISAFSVLVRIMSELKLLCTDIGEVAVPSAAINDVAVWTLLGVGVAMTGEKHDHLIPLWVILCGIAFTLLMFTIVRKLMSIVAHQATKEGQSNMELYVCITLVGVLVAGFCSDALGVHPLLGPFFFGLLIPKDNDFPQIITQKIEDIVTSLMLPLFFASSGLKTNLGSLHGINSLGFLVLFFAIAAIGKIAGTTIVARLNGIPTRRALILGFLMNTKGLAVLIVLNVGRDLKVLNDEVFAVLVSTCLLTSFVTYPAVTALCRGGNVDTELIATSPSFRKPPRSRNFRILLTSPANQYDDSRMTSAVSGLVEALRHPKSNCTVSMPSTSSEYDSIEIHTCALVKDVDRSSSVIWPGQRPMMSVEGTDLCDIIAHPCVEVRDTSGIVDVAIKNDVNVILVPYALFQDASKTNPLTNSSGPIDFDLDRDLEFDRSCCPVCIIAYPSATLSRGSIFPESSNTNPIRVVVFYVNDPHDSEALLLGCHMAHHPRVSLDVVQLTTSPIGIGNHTKAYPSDTAQFSTTNKVQSQHLRMELNLDKNLHRIDIPSHETKKDDIISHVKKLSQEHSSITYKEVSVKEDDLGSKELLCQVLISISQYFDMTNIDFFIVGGEMSSTTKLSPHKLKSQHTNHLGLFGTVLSTSSITSHANILVVHPPHAK